MATIAWSSKRPGPDLELGTEAEGEAGNIVRLLGTPGEFDRGRDDTGDALGLKSVLLTTTVDEFRLPTVTTLDGRAEKKFTFGAAQVAVDFDVFNLLNANTMTGRNMTSGPNFGLTTGILLPRLAEAAVSLRF